MKLIAAIAAALVLAPAAHAQVTCPDITALVDPSRARFATIVGRQNEDRVHASTYGLPDAMPCEVDFHDIAMFWCARYYPTYDEGLAAYEASVGMAKPCLAAWSVKPREPYRMDE